MDKDIDAMIEKSEQTLDVEENKKLVKDIQMECIKRFSSRYTLFTLYRNYLVSSRVQNLDLAVVTPIYHHEAWLKA